MQRWKRHGTWARLGALFACYLLVPALTTVAIAVFDAPDSAKEAFILMLFIAFPLATIALAAWDGITEGFTVLWTVMPIVSFIVPMFIFFNESALFYGAIYSVLAMVANGLGSLFRAKSHSTSSPRES